MPLSLVGLLLAPLAAAVAFIALVRKLGRRIDSRMQTGDVDADGQIVDELRDRLDGAIGPVADDVDRCDHLQFVLLMLARSRRLAKGGA